jgi:hypothetical protein
LSVLSSDKELRIRRRLVPEIVSCFLCPIAPHRAGGNGNVMPKTLSRPAMMLPGGKAKMQRIFSRDTGVARSIERVQFYGAELPIRDVRVFVAIVIKQTLIKPHSTNSDL